MQLDTHTVRRFKVVAECDPGALVRVLQFIQARNIVPRRANMHRVGSEYLEIEIEIDAADCAPDAFRIVVGKVNELPVVLVATECA